MQLKTTTFISSISEGNVTQYDLLKSSCEQFIGDLTAAREIMLIESRINSLTDLINAHMTVIKEKFQASTQASQLYLHLSHGLDFIKQLSPIEPKHQDSTASTASNQRGI